MFRPLKPCIAWKSLGMVALPLAGAACEPVIVQGPAQYEADISQRTQEATARKLRTLRQLAGDEALQKNEAAVESLLAPDEAQIAAAKRKGMEFRSPSHADGCIMRKAG